MLKDKFGIYSLAIKFEDRLRALLSEALRIDTYTVSAESAHEETQVLRFAAELYSLPVADQEITAFISEHILPVKIAVSDHALLGTVP